MIQNLKALAVVMVLALLIFRLARPICLHFVDAADFDRRRGVWLAITALAFLSPSFWLYVALAAPTLLLATKADRNPAALYLMMLFAVPPVTLPIPVVGINHLFELNHQRLLSFVILLPAALRAVPSLQGRARIGGADGAYLSLLAYLGLVLALYVPYESMTNTMRRAFEFIIDVVLVYHVFQRLGAERKAVVEALFMLGVATALMAAVAVFESLRGWLLYTNLGNVWGNPNLWAWLMRGDSLRAQASTGHALTLGYLLAMGFGASLLLQTRLDSRIVRWGVVGCIWAGLLASLSRGPWLTAGVVFLVFVALKPQGLSGLLKVALVGACLVVAILVSPIGEHVVSYLPFVGSVDSQNVQYRQALFETSVTIIKQNPVFGNPGAMMQMEHLRQGQGIIDLVNGYLVVALFYGLVGLTLFLLLPLMVLARAFRAWYSAKRTGDHELTYLGACLMAMMVGTMIFIATAAYGVVFYVLAGLLASYSAMSPSSASAKPTQRNSRAPSARGQEWAVP
jgi:O-Antigen ligase